MAIDLTGISNVNEFYSHHYLDSLLEGDLKGLYEKWQEGEERSPYEKLSGIAQKYFRAKTDAFNEKKPEERVEVTRAFHTSFLEVLGYEVYQQLKFTEDGQALPILSTVNRNGNEHLWVIESVFWGDDVSVFEQSMVLESQNDEVTWFDDSIDTGIKEIFCLEEPPKWLILLAGQKVYLIDRSKWGYGKYLLFDLDELFGRKQTDTLKATAALLSKDALSPEEGNVLHDELDENSHKHAFSVSEDLKYGIRRAVELIGNEFIYYRSRVAKQKLYGDEELASNLTKECLTYLYRLLFLFYAESRSEQLNVVPMKSEEYRLGYSLENLRELELVPLTTEASRQGYFMHKSINTLFKIVNEGFGNESQFEIVYESGRYADVGFNIEGLQSPLFDLKQTPLLSSVKIRNYVLQEVIQLLSLSKEGSKQRGRISYAQLGINQLGAVYEGLLSYSGFFAQERLFEVKPNNVNSTDETGQSYFVAESEINQYKDDEFVLYKADDGIIRRKKYEKGSFIFRLAGRDREKSASYYTPEVLTQSLVKYSLEELLKDKTADEILELTVCEPAMGSGAFLNETINQLADAYLQRKQNELGTTINPDDYAYEKQRVKTYLATNNIYGVDLNPTAVELAKISLWLNTIYEGSSAPWFSPRLGTGNSLVGIRNQVYTKNDLLCGKWHNKVPEKTSSYMIESPDEIYHFLVPDKGMATFEKDKVIKDIASKEIEQIKLWKKDFIKDFDSSELNTLQEISFRISQLWNKHLKSRMQLLALTKEEYNLWGMENRNEKEGNLISVDVKEKELNKQKNSPTSAYKCLKFIMDYWCALWFWPINKAELLPTRDEYLTDLTVILDTVQGFGTNIDDLIKSVERLNVVNEVSNNTSFFHWELEFAEVFFKRKGFDLIVGNPPWIKYTWEEKGVLSEALPIINLRKFNASKVSQLRSDLLRNDRNFNEYLSEYVEIVGQKSFLSSNLYHQLKGVQLNLYKSFIVLSIELVNVNGIMSFIHLEGVYDDAKGNKFREYLYPKLRYHFQFINELKLFSEVHHLTKFGLSIFSPKDLKKIEFYNVSNLFHPKTLDISFSHTGGGEVPGVKTKTNNWETKGHLNRIIKYDNNLLNIINKLYEDDDVKTNCTKLLNIHSTEVINVIKKLSSYRYKLKTISDEIFYTSMFHETNAQKNGLLNKETIFPESIEKMIYSGPHFFVGNPIYKTPNENCKHNLDYNLIDLTSIEKDYLPRTNYTLTPKGYGVIPKWDSKPVTKRYRHIYRKMLSPTGERTFIGAIIPKEPSHIDGCGSIAFKDNNLLLGFSGMSYSIVVDFYIKSMARTNLYKEIYNLPLPNKSHPLFQYIAIRTLRLNCLTTYYADLWEELFDKKFKYDSFSKVNNLLVNDWDELSEKWNEKVAFRTDYSRRQALVELDVLSALVLNLSFEELLTIYRVQFPVLQKYELENYYDQQGKLVSRNAIKYYEKNSGNVESGDPLLEGFIPPFDSCNRESDLRQAYEYFSGILKEQEAKGGIIYDSINFSK